MGKRDPRVDAYIAKSADFAQPILAHLRDVVHATCPDVEEDIKWSMPFFAYHGNLCQIAAFKAHCAFGFWRGKEIPGLEHEAGNAMGMGSVGRIESMADVPPKRELVRFIKAAMALNDSGAKPVRTKAAPKATIAIPPDLEAALKANRKAQSGFVALPPGAQRDYLEWIVEARREATRASRIATTVEWTAEGKKRNWKYETC